MIPGTLPAPDKSGLPIEDIQIQEIIFKKVEWHFHQNAQ
jgi:hypothetical protein